MRKHGKKAGAGALVLLFGAASVAGVNARAEEEVSCVRLLKAEGATCGELEAKFDLSGCGGGAASVDAQLRCAADSLAEAVIPAGEHRYRTTLTRNEGAEWLPGLVFKVPMGKGPAKSGTQASSASATLSARTVAAAEGTMAPSGAPANAGAAQASGGATPADSGAAPASEGTSFVLKGQFRTRFESSHETDLATFRSMFLLRVRPGILWKIADNASVYFEPQFAKALGEPVFVGQSTTSNARQETSGQLYDTGINAHQAYGSYRPSSCFNLIAGLQILSYGDELLVGAVEWSNVGRSFDAIRVRSEHTLGWSDLFFSKLQDTNITGSGQGDKDFFGLYSSSKLGSFLQAADLYVLYLRDATVATPTRLWTGGLRAKSVVDSLDYRIEGTYQGGDTHGQQVDAEAGYTFDHSMKPRLGLGAFYASKDFNQLFPTAHKWLGYADVLGRRNLQGFRANGTLKLNERLLTQLEYHYFARAKTDAQAYKLNGVTPLRALTTQSSAKGIGSELDLTLKYQASKAVGVSAGGSYFFLGSYLEEQFAGSRPTFYYVQLDMVF